MTNSEAGQIARDGNSEPYVAVILTAIPVEIEEVSKHLTEIDETTFKSFVFDRGTFTGSSGRWSILVGECGPGNSSAANIASSAIDQFDPDVLLFVGIAGGIKDVELGDVVASSKVYNIHSGKSGPEFLPRPITEWSDTSLEQRARAVRRREDWINRIIVSGETRVKKPAAYVGPIAAGESVVSSDTSQIFVLIQESYGDSLAVEMEGSGILNATRHHRIPGIVVRGISDLCINKADTDKEGWQTYAAAHAAAFTFELLSKHSPPGRLIYSKKPIESINHNDLKTSNGSDQSTTNTEKSIGEDSKKNDSINAKHYISSLSSYLTSLSIRSDEWIRRPEEMKLKSLIGEPNEQIICLLGSPGSGKTSLLAKLTNDFIEQGIQVLALKADLLPINMTLDAWVQEQTGVDLPLKQVINYLANDQRIIVVVDQLDALADLVDLSSDRLNQFLELIQWCAKQKNVSVVCSCRTLEFHHDTRLSSLEAECIQLELPTWKQISDELNKEGIENSDSWSDDFREVLRTPQHLKIFLDQYRETDNQDVLCSYQLMLDNLWERKVTKEEQRDLLYQLTEHFIQEESIWISTIQFESHASTIRELESVGILKREGARISFSHQTLLEHAKARLFTKTGQSLCKYVLERQDAIYVRPTIWSVLGYLREADRSKYLLELTALLNADIRLHIRFLLIEFLGQVNNPYEQEVLLMSAQLQDEEFRLRVLIAIIGSEGWFRTFYQKYFPSIMEGNKYYLWQMKNIIVGAWDFAHDECLELVSKYWVENESKDDLTISAMRELDRWDQAKVDVICRIIQRTKVNDEEPERLWWAEDLVNLISEHEPELAPQVFVTTVSHVKSKYSPLENSNSWHQLPAVAEAAPITFFETVWPWFVTACETWHIGPKSSVINHYGGSLSSLDPYTGGPGYPLMSSFLYSLNQIATKAPKRFYDIVKNSWKSDSKPVHRIIARGLSNAGLKLTKEALVYLYGDERRFLLGNYDQHEQDETIQLIQVFSPSLNQEEVNTLTNKIQTWNKYEPGEIVSNDQDTLIREDRLRLLNAISSEHNSDETIAFIETEKKELTGWNSTRMTGRVGRVKELPPLTKEEMKNSSDETIIQTLKETPPLDRSFSNWIEDGGYWEEPGGIESLARELRDLAKENYERILPLLPQLIKNGYESIAGNVLYDLDKSSITNNEVYDLIQNLDQLNPQSEEYRSEAGYLLYRRCDKDSGLPDDICQILEKWLNMPWSNQHAFDDVPENKPEKEEGEPSSYLWSTRGGIIDSGKPFFSMLALTNGYLWRKKRDTDRWLKFIEELLDKEISTRTWIAYCEQLRWIRLKGCDLDYGRSVIQKLFDKHPGIPFTQEGIQLIASASFDLTEEFIIGFLDNLLSQNKKELCQAYGELLTLIAIRGEPHLWAKEVLENGLKQLDSEDELSESIVTGMAFAAARLWDEYDARKNACNVLCQLIPHATPKVARAIGTVFWSSEDFQIDQYSEKLLLSIQSHPEVIQGRITTDFVDFLASLLPNYRTIILQITKNILAAHSDQIMNYASELHMAGPTLVNISMTLQRFEETRSEATTLLEQMLKMGLDEAYNFLIENDLRPGKVNRRSPRKRRRRKR